MTLHLTPAQEDLVSNVNDSFIIHAASGSGKTTVLIEKVRRLIQKGFKHESILVMFPKEEALEECRKSLFESIGGDCDSLSLMTADFFCMEMLSRFGDLIGLKPNFVIYNRSHQRQIIMDILLDKCPEKSGKTDPHYVRKNIALLKQNLISTEEFNESKDDFFLDKSFGAIYNHYQATLAKNNAIDRDDLVLLTVQLLRRNTKILNYIQSQYSFGFIDDFEDFTEGEKQMIFILAKTLVRCHVNVHRDIDVHQIKELLPKFSYRELEQCFNFRVEEFRENKNKTHKTVGDAPALLTYFIAVDEKEEAGFVAEKIAEYMNTENLRSEDFAVMFRTMSQASILESTLKDKGIPYHLIGNLNKQMKSEIKDMMAYLRLVHNPGDDQAFLQLSRLPIHALRLEQGLKLQSLAEQNKCTIYDYLKDQKDHYRGEKDFFALIDDLSLLFKKENKTMAELVAAILDSSGYSGMLIDENSLDSLERLETIQDFIRFLDEHPLSMDEFLRKHKGMVALKAFYNHNADGVSLLTLDQAKHHSFQVVFIVGVEEGLLPHYEAQFDRGHLNQEKHLFYVGITRAKRAVFITSVQQRSIFGKTWFNELSRFITEIPRQSLVCFVSNKFKNFGEEFLEKLEDNAIQYFLNTETPKIDSEDTNIKFAVGDEITHPKWGVGEVRGIEGEGEKMVLNIKFGNETKKLMAKYALFS